jgi:hypothetical protein
MDMPGKNKLMEGSLVKHEGLLSHDKIRSPHEMRSKDEPKIVKDNNINIDRYSKEN